MDRETMSNEENYCFDLAGYLHVPGVLVRGEVERLNKALDEAGRINHHEARRRHAQYFLKVLVKL